MSFFFSFILSAALILGVAGCKKDAQSPQSAAVTETPEVQGQKLYVQLCIACHNANPKEDGLVGPANAGASMDLLRAKVLKNEYPPGYSPKRATKAMTPFPLTDLQLTHLHAYLNSVK